MMYGNHFYNELTRKYAAVFGSHFNDIIIERRDNNGTLVQTMTVPLHYAPMQKILARLEQDPNLSAPALTLPRMSFEITNIEYDPARKLGSTLRYTSNTADPNERASVFAPAPYRIDFELNVMAKYNEDGTKIIEQILPYFKPDVVPRVELLNDIPAVDIPITLNSVTKEDVYEGSFEERRALIWTLTFTMNAFFYGPVTAQKLIKFVEVNEYSDTDADTEAFQRITVQPGLTANGEPTTDVNNSIDWNLIEKEDDWSFIVTIEDLP